MSWQDAQEQLTADHIRPSIFSKCMTSIFWISRGNIHDLPRLPKNHQNLSKHTVKISKPNPKFCWSGLAQLPCAADRTSLCMQCGRRQQSLPWHAGNVWTLLGSGITQGYFVSISVFKPHRKASKSGAQHTLPQPNNYRKVNDQPMTNLCICSDCMTSMLDKYCDTSLWRQVLLPHVGTFLCFFRQWGIEKGARLQNLNCKFVHRVYQTYFTDNTWGNTADTHMIRSLIILYHKLSQYDTIRTWLHWNLVIDPLWSIHSKVLDLLTISSSFVPKFWKKTPQRRQGACDLVAHARRGRCSLIQVLGLVIHGHKIS